jgi:dTDP-4-dehydrorhamnose 3,5-epimerase
MRSLPLDIEGVVIIQTEPFHDERGWFLKLYSQEELRPQGLDLDVTQVAISQNAQRGTLRGLHYQAPPHGEVKLVRCISGAVLDVVADVRPGSPTYLQWRTVELSEDSDGSLLIPVGVAHGFITLTEDARVLYLMSGSYEPSAARGVRYDDPALGIRWPIDIAVINDRDMSFPYITPEY